MNDRVEIRVGGKTYGGWKSVVIEIGMDQLTRGFKLSVTDTFPGNTDFHRLRNGDRVQLFIGDDLICTGYIDHVNVSYNGTSITVTVDGKSKTVDLVDCCPVAKYGAIASKSDNAWTGVVVGKDGKSTRFPPRAFKRLRGRTSRLQRSLPLWPRLTALPFTPRPRSAKS